MGDQSRTGQCRDDPSRLGHPKTPSARRAALVLQELETARALGIAELAAGRLAVQKATGSAKPPGGVLHVLAIGVDKFGDKAGDLHLDYAAEDAHDVATALEESQKLGPGKGEPLRRRQNVNTCQTIEPTTQPFAMRSTTWRQA